MLTAEAAEYAEGEEKDGGREKKRI